MRILELGALAICAFLSSCVVHVGQSTISGPKIRGNGVQGHEARELSLEPVSGVQVSGAIDVVVEWGETSRVELEGDRNVLPYVEVTVRECMVNIGLVSGSYDLDLPLRARVTLPRCDNATVSGSGNMLVRDLDGGALSANVAGSGNLELRGALDQLWISVHGSGDVVGRHLDVNSAEVSVHGSGNVALSNVRQLKAQVFGSGDVTYTNEPEVLDRKIQGSGTVRRR